jgi:hypothetical protein
MASRSLTADARRPSPGAYAGLVGTAGLFDRRDGSDDSERRPRRPPDTEILGRLRQLARKGATLRLSIAIHPSAAGG